MINFKKLTSTVCYIMVWVLTLICYLCTAPATPPPISAVQPAASDQSGGKTRFQTKEASCLKFMGCDRSTG